MAGIATTFDDAVLRDGTRLAVGLAPKLRESGGRHGIASARIGGGQGIALLIENGKK